MKTAISCSVTQEWQQHFLHCLHVSFMVHSKLAKVKHLEVSYIPRELTRSLPSAHLLGLGKGEKKMKVGVHIKMKGSACEKRMLLTLHANRQTKVLREQEKKEWMSR